MRRPDAPRRDHKVVLLDEPARRLDSAQARQCTRPPVCARAANRTHMSSSSSGMTSMRFLRMHQIYARMNSGASRELTGQCHSRSRTARSSWNCGQGSCRSGSRRYGCIRMSSYAERTRLSRSAVGARRSASTPPARCSHLLPTEANPSRNVEGENGDAPLNLFPGENRCSPNHKRGRCPDESALSQRIGRNRRDGKVILWLLWHASLRRGVCGGGG